MVQWNNSDRAISAVIDGSEVVQEEFVLRIQLKINLLRYT